MRKVGAKNLKNSNTNCIMAQIKRMEQQLDKTHTILFVHKAKANPKISTQR